MLETTTECEEPIWILNYYDNHAMVLDGTCQRLITMTSVI